MDISIDIETLGTKPGSVILSIGAVAFDRNGSVEDTKPFYAAIDLEDSLRLGMTTDAATIKWWLTQDQLPRQQAFSGTEELKNVLADLRTFIKLRTPEFIWAKPPSFDISLLESAFEIVGLELPWTFRQPRDCRTLFYLTDTHQPEYGTAHNALDDAISQAHGVIAAFKRMNELKAA